MGEPEYLSALQVEQLEAASALRKEAQPWTQENGNYGPGRGPAAAERGRHHDRIRMIW
jgi:hypothetical protein